MELEAYKAELARAVLNVDDYAVLDSVKVALSGREYFAHTYDAPCQMSLAEVKAKLNESNQRFERGEYVSEEEMELFFDALR